MRYSTRPEITNKKESKKSPAFEQKDDFKTFYPLNVRYISSELEDEELEPKRTLEELLKTNKSISGKKGPEGPPGEYLEPKEELIISKGHVGATGPKGHVGATGPKGHIGATGPKGHVGATGPKGPVGVTGPKGDQGPLGVTGPKGHIGVTGPKGDQGPVGVTGPKGDQGPAGITGPKGHIGVTGPKGDQGPVGVTGPKGDQGPKGYTYKCYNPNVKIDKDKTVSIATFLSDGKTDSKYIVVLSSDEKTECELCLYDVTEKKKEIVINISKATVNQNTIHEVLFQDKNDRKSILELRGCKTSASVKILTVEVLLS